MITRWFVRLVIAGLLDLLLSSSGAPGQTVTEPVSKIASNNPLWIETGGEAAAASVRVDVGTIRRIKDELEAHWSQPLSGPLLQITQRRFPGVTIPEGSTRWDTVRIVCNDSGTITSLVERTITSPAGKTLAKTTRSPAVQRSEQERSKLRLEYPFNYGRNPSSMACWAASRKCSGQDFTWPPPSLDSDAPKQESAAYIKQFIPSCGP